MEVSVNGKPTPLDGPCPVSELLERLQIDQRPCAVEVNRNLIPRREHGNVLLADGDEIEIVTLVGGG